MAAPSDRDSAAGGGLHIPRPDNIDAKDRQLRQHLCPFFGSILALPGHNEGLFALSDIKARAAKVLRFKEENGRIVYLTDTQCAALLSAATQDHNENVHAFILVGLHTSMRHSEILAIRRDDIDLGRRVIWKAKAGAREQPITADLCQYLERRMQMLPPGCGWLFPSPGSAEGNVHTIRKAFRRCVTRAGMDPDQITPHTLRHTAVTHLVQSGVDLPTVQRISGHKTLTMVARYAHHNGAHIQSAMNRLSDRIGSGRSADEVTVTSEKLP